MMPEPTSKAHLDARKMVMPTSKAHLYPQPPPPPPPAKAGAVPGEAEQVPYVEGISPTQPMTQAEHIPGPQCLFGAYQDTIDLSTQSSQKQRSPTPPPTQPSPEADGLRAPPMWAGAAHAMPSSATAAAAGVASSSSAPAAAAVGAADSPPPPLSPKPPPPPQKTRPRAEQQRGEADSPPQERAQKYQCLPHEEQEVQGGASK